MANDHDETKLEWWRDQLEEYEGARGEAKKKGAFAAYAAIGKRMEVARAEIDKLIEAGATVLEDLTEEEFLEELTKQAQEMPEQHIEVFVSEYHRRFGQRHLRLVGESD